MTNIAGMAVASLMVLQAKSTCPHRIESERLVMFYDDRVTDPQRDLEAMDQHVAQLERETGKPLRERIYWVRGELLGQRRMAFSGIALGSSRSPTNWETADHPDRLSEDRHELAHAVILQLQPADTDAPTLLIEGWAEAHAGMTSHKRAEGAKQSRALWWERTGAGPTRSYLRELTGPSWYHRIDGPVYSVGGALAEFVARKYGTERFLRWYFASRPGRFEAGCTEQLGVEFDTLESEFWAEVERLTGPGLPDERDEATEPIAADDSGRRGTGVAISRFYSISLHVSPSTRERLPVPQKVAVHTPVDSCPRLVSIDELSGTAMTSGRLRTPGMGTGTSEDLRASPHFPGPPHNFCGVT
jgi:hypothetical protein